MPKKAINTRISEEQHARLMAEIGDEYDHATQWVRDQIEDAVRDGAESDDEGHYPVDRGADEIYRSLLDHGRVDDVVCLDEISGSVAQDVQIAKTDLPARLRYLRKHGYVTMYSELRPGAPKYIRIKPPAARPDKWTRREHTYRHERGYRPPEDDLFDDGDNVVVREVDTDDVEDADERLDALDDAEVAA